MVFISRALCSCTMLDGVLQSCAIPAGGAVCSCAILIGALCSCTVRTGAAVKLKHFAGGAICTGVMCSCTLEFCHAYVLICTQWRSDLGPGSNYQSSGQYLRSPLYQAITLVPNWTQLGLK